MTEADLQDAIIDLAEWCGYRIHHDRPARDSKGGWTTHIQGDIGFPDLVLAHPVTGTIIFAELKSHKGKITDSQMRWLVALGMSNHSDPQPITPGDTATYLWHTTDWGHEGNPIAETILRGANRYDPAKRGPA